MLIVNHAVIGYDASCRQMSMDNLTQGRVGPYTTEQMDLRH